ncbi:LysR family transcriptional regulator [Pseudomonas sp. OST1909]|uniref:LysR family transcriptional regulator n=1 Tax=Pseudomonas sp. OST1909 TaxID=2777367 RepID=UPI001889B753|nr:LysR family transcriptional regulator [Pseudomonas sp. OST1909]QOY72980.1 LysR family transcriptional regulator [Pseudomonas sp. OST1909]
MNTNENRLVAARLDLNLFRVFSAIYSERNLTRAADMLFVSQSAVSHSLGRMRELLGDQLFVREAQGVVPTHFSERIWPDIQVGLAHFESVVTNRRFDPVRDVRKVTLAIPDLLESDLLPLFTKAINKENPGIQVNSTRIKRSLMKQDLLSGRIDCAVDVTLSLDDNLNHYTLMRDEFVVVSRSAKALSYENYFSAKHITVSTRRTGLGIIDYELNKLGLGRNIAIRCQQYKTACLIASNSDLLLTIPRSMVGDNPNLGIHIHALPINLPPAEVALIWHKSKNSDSINTWIRLILLTAANTKMLHAYAAEAEAD